MAPPPLRRQRVALATASILLALGGCDWTKPKVPGAEQRSAARKQADARRLRDACGSAVTYDRLKAFVFDEANRLHAGRTAVLDRVQANTTVRMEQPVAVSRDEQLDVTVCRGRLVLDLPPGVEDAFNGARQLKAEVEYSAQAAVDGSGLVYQMKSAEPIIYRLAALTLPAAGTAPAPVPDVVTAPTDRVEVAQTSPEGDATPPPPPAARPIPAPNVPARTRTAAAVPPAGDEPVVAPEPRRAASPSFNCARVSGRVLRTICADPSLAALDRRMSARFYAALADADPDIRAALRGSRDRFLRFRDRCPDVACVAQSYEERMAEIRDIAQR